MHEAYLQIIMQTIIAFAYFGIYIGKGRTQVAGFLLPIQTVVIATKKGKQTITLCANEAGNVREKDVNFEQITAPHATVAKKSGCKKCTTGVGEGKV